MKTTTTSPLYTGPYPVLHSGTEVFEIRSLILDNLFDSPIDPGSFRAFINSTAAIYKDSRGIFASQNILPLTTGQMTEGVPLSEPRHVTSAVPETIMGNWQLLAQAGLTTKTYAYIFKLASKNDGWRGHGSRPMNAQSLAAFLQLWNQIAEFAQEPEFVLMPNGNLQIEWYRDDNHFVELEFQPNNKIIFGMFDGETVIEGVAHVKEIVPLLQQRNFNPLKRPYVVKRKLERKLQS